MTDARKITWNECIQSLDATKLRIFEIFKKAFSEGEGKPSGHTLNKLKVFLFIWEKFEKLNAKTLAYLDGFFNAELADFEKNIKKFCKYEIFIQYEEISPDKINICKSLFHVAYFFSRAKFLFLQFSEKAEADSVEHFSVKRQWINKQFDDFRERFSSIDEEKVRNEIHELNKVMKLISKQLYDKGYLERGSDTKEMNKDLLANPNFQTINVALLNLPTLNEITQACNHNENINSLFFEIDECHNQIKKEMDAIFKQYQSRIDGIKAVTVGVQMFFQWVLTEKSFFACNQRLLELMNTLDFLQSETIQDLINLCKSQSKSEKLSFGIISKGWGEAADEIHVQLSLLADHLNKFISQYRTNVDTKQLFEHHKNDIEGRLSALTDAGSMLEKQISDAKETWARYSQAIDAKRHILDKNAAKESHPASLFYRHWGKSLMGGLIGAGLAALAVTLLIPGLNLIAMAAVVVSSILLGSVLAFGAGVAFDAAKACCAPKPSKIDNSLNYRHDNDIDALFESDDEVTVPMELAKEKTEKSEVSSQCAKPFSFFGSKAGNTSPESNQNVMLGDEKTVKHQ